MATPIPLRSDFDRLMLRRLARTTKDAAQARRLLSLAEIYDGGSRSDAARVGSVTLQIVRDWVMRFNARGPEGLINVKAPGGRDCQEFRVRAGIVGPKEISHGSPERTQHP